MRKAEIETLFAYNYWANRRILNKAGGLSEADLNAPSDLSHGSLMETLEHVLYAEWIWRMRCAERFSPGRGYPWSSPLTFSVLQARWVEEERAMCAFLGGLEDEALSERIDYTTTSGEARRNLLWELLAHIVNHGTQHRSEAALQLSRLGRSPGDIDLIIYLRERSR